MFVYEGHRVKVKVTVAKNRQRSVSPQCETSIGNNSSSIKHRVVKFACTMGSSAMTDAMLRQPSLSRDRKRPRVTKCTYSRVVCLSLEGSLVRILFRGVFQQPKIPASYGLIVAAARNE